MIDLDRLALEWKLLCLVGALVAFVVALATAKAGMVAIQIEGSFNRRKFRSSLRNAARKIENRAKKKDA